MRLIPKRKDVKPMIYEAPMPQTVDYVTMKEIKSFFVNYMLSDQLGMIANALLAKADALESGACLLKKLPVNLLQFLVNEIKEIVKQTVYN